MFERFNEAARRALFFSRYEAGLLGERVIGTEHVLLGVLREPGAILAPVWDALGVDPEAIRRKYPSGEMLVATSAELPLSGEARRIMDGALREADARQSREVGPHHLLLAMLRIPGSRAARELAAAGVTYEGLSEALAGEP